MPSPTRDRVSVAALLTLAAIAGSENAAAQVATDSSAAPSEPAGARVPRVILAGGVDAAHNDRGGYPTQLALHLGYQLRGGALRGGPRLGVRLGLDVTGSEIEAPSGTLPFASRRSRAAGLLVLGSYALTRGPVRPYLLGGAGMYMLRAATTYRYYAVTASGAREPDRTERVSDGGFGLSAGAGLAAPIGGVVVFGEARATLLPGSALSDTPGVRGTQLPLVLGVRF